MLSAAIASARRQPLTPETGFHGGAEGVVSSHIVNRSRPARFRTNGREVVFPREGDLWIAPLSGGNTDVFVIPAEGAPPDRLTYHPAAARTGRLSPVSHRIAAGSPTIDSRSTRAPASP
jgi:hypothetical protein